MEHCQDYKAHEEHLKRTDARLLDLERGYDEMHTLMVKIDTLVSSMQRMYWILITAVVTALVASMAALITRM